MIKIKNLIKTFGKNEVLKGVDLDFDQPGITAVLGPNGSGKTTLIKCILGMVIPQSGRIEFRDKNVRNQWQYRDDISYLPQIARFPENLKVKELFDMVKDLRHEKPSATERFIELFELESHLDKRLGNLSGGTKQKVNLTLVFMFDNPVLILDEPTAGLDPVAIIRLKSLLEEARAAGKHIIITTHIMSFVEEIADEIVFLLDGNIYFRGSVDGLKSRFEEEQLERAIAALLQQKKQHVHTQPEDGKNLLEQQPLESA